ncbi:YceI family protein [Thioalkalivibrio sp.]|uniref:YceI family protein n=1 Tax=Thioalkalivibrio sp. TaxID=2093813 RepID=UPI0012D6CAE5|nr:YceI family protein [Thioalkalivibrio sp.]TVP81268.1 MAG: YceI family protein [Thioalkalivibrio sp.]
MLSKKTAVALVSILAASAASADWTLNNAESALFYLTTKNVNVTELNTFNRLSGNVSQAGEANVAIDLTSVDTAISIRDERKQTMLFDVENFPSAKIRMNFDPALLEDMAPGARVVQNAVPFQLTIHDITHEKEVGLVVVGLENGLQVSNLQPVVVEAEPLGLAGGIEALRAIVNLPNITTNAPVNFTLVFDKD